MKNHNIEVRSKIEQNRKMLTSLRRADIVMQFRNQMVAKGIRNSDIAERLCVSEANVSRWLKGNQNLSLDTLYLLADAVEEPLTFVVGAHQISAYESGTEISDRNRSDWAPVPILSCNFVEVVVPDRYLAATKNRLSVTFRNSKSVLVESTQGERDESTAALA
jgi:transcriptional regulator with XRE-family HTH domain